MIGTLMVLVPFATGLVMFGLSLYVLVMVRTPERHREVFVRWYRMLNAISGESARQFAGAPAVCAMFFFVVGLMMCVYGVGELLSDPAVGRGWPDGVWWAFAICLALWIPTLLMMVLVPRTGRPRALVLRPLRGATESEAEAWLTPAPTSAGED